MPVPSRARSGTQIEPPQRGEPSTRDTERQRLRHSNSPGLEVGGTETGPLGRGGEDGERERKTRVDEHASTSIMC